MLTMLRAEAQEMLLRVPARRRPALRRTDVPGFLLATDLPLAADEASVTAFTDAMIAQGWRVERQGSWLQLDCPVPVPSYSLPLMQGEAGCCLSLLLRHPEGGDSGEMIRCVVKAADAGRIPFERLCGQLHGELAAMLRQHMPLPDGLIPYLCCACSRIYG